MRVHDLIVESPASLAGIQEDDVIAKINGESCMFAQLSEWQDVFR